MSLAGFDFGTTNSLVAVARNGGLDKFLDKGRPTPSAICYEGTQKIVGREAKSRLSQAGLGVLNNIIRSPKSLLGQVSVSLEGIERSPVDIVSDVVSAIAADVRSRDNGLPDLSDVVVTIPVDMDGKRRRELRDAGVEFPFRRSQPNTGSLD